MLHWKFGNCTQFSTDAVCMVHCGTTVEWYFFYQHALSAVTSINYHTDNHANHTSKYWNFMVMIARESDRIHISIACVNTCRRILRMRQVELIKKNILILCLLGGAERLWLHRSALLTCVKWLAFPLATCIFLPAAVSLVNAGCGLCFKECTTPLRNGPNMLTGAKCQVFLQSLSVAPI